MATFIDPATVTRTVLANGLTVLIQRDTTAPVAAVNTFVRAGYFDESDDIIGIAHVLEHMFFKGTPTYAVGEIAKATKAAGGYLNAHTIYDHTSYYAVLPASGFAEGLAVQADAYANSMIDADELRRELEVIIQEAKRKEDNPGAVTTETLYALLHDTHRIRRWRIGREEGLRALRRDQMLGFYRNFYTPSNTVLAISGDVDVDATLKKVDRLYGHLPAGEPVRTPGPAEPEHAGFRYRELCGDVEQTHCEIGWRTVPALHEDVAPLDLLAAVLGSGRASRLYRAVRDRQLAGSVGAYNYSPPEVGVFVVSSEGKPDRAVDAARAMWAQVRAVRDGAIDGAAIDRAHRLFAARWARSMETAEGRAAYLAEWESLGGWQLGDEYYDAFMRADADAATDVARRYLTEERAGFVTYRPEDAPEIAADADAALVLLTNGTATPLVTVPREPTPRAAAPARATFEREEAGVRVYRLASGIPVLVRVRPGAAITHMGVYAGAGSAHEPRERAGITALAARTSVRATSSRNALAIAEESELLGGSIGTSVGSESLGWSFSVPTANVAPALALLADVVQHATIPEEALETERAALLADLAQLRDDMYRYPMRLLHEVAYAGHPYSIPATGTEDTVRAIAVDEVRNWYRTAMLRAPFVIGVAGDGDPDALAQLVAGQFGEIAMAERAPLSPPTWPAGDRERIATRDKAQTALAIAFPSPSRNDDQRFAARVLASVASGLGGRFFEELRDRRSLAYTVHAFDSEQRLAGMFIAYIATSPEREDEARDGLIQEFARLREEEVTPEELERARRYLLGMHDIRQERGGAVLSDMVDAWLFGTSLRELDEFDARIGSVTAADLRQLALTYFDPMRIVEGVVRGAAAPNAAVPAVA